MRLSELVVHSGGENTVLRRRAYVLDKWGNSFGDTKCPNRVCVRHRRAGNRKQRVLLNRHERVDRCRIKLSVILVRRKEKCALASIVQGKTDRSAEGEAGIVLLEG